MKKNKIFKSIMMVILISILIELILRSAFGFCDTVLIMEDADFEYIAKPNQNRLRFGNRVIYNSKSMRSDEVDSLSTKILCFGDSVLNGGVLTDQSNLASTILSDTLSYIFNKKVQFLNISMGSWGPDNCYAYLNKYGGFGSNSFYLVVSSHDAYDNMTHEKIVDVHDSFPSHQSKLALFELVDRYLIPKLTSFFVMSSSYQESLAINKKKKEDKFNSGFDSFNKYCRSRNICLTIYLHAERSELINGSYNEQGLEIIAFAKNNNIDIIEDLGKGLQLSDFRDNIHINEYGQRRIAKLILESELMKKGCK